ncbi:site-specific DNA-methyltransferase [Amycolatopsis sp. NPDC004079]|uniref:DNA-methyltransferase n=1 Tax=Amycolatopsis sp. NPDC004079 TaxID=3154549 RepID=UPI0033A291D9
MPTILRADARSLPLADDSVDLVVTSPPYFRQRSYQDGGRHYDRQLGAESTVAEYLDALLEATRECLRVLKPSGSIWVNLGDKYAARCSSRQASGRAVPDGDDGIRCRSVPNRVGIREKSLLGLPWRYALRCIDELGLILRAEVVWFKPNGLPESVRDRVRRSHETWFQFTARPRYYSAVDEIREPAKADLLVRPQSRRALETFYAAGFGEAHLAAVRAVAGLDGKTSTARRGGARDHEAVAMASEVRAALGSLYPDLCASLGKLPGSVWEVATQPLKVPEELGVDHFAAFPMELPRRMILGWSPREICTACGEGRRPAVAAQRTLDGRPVAIGGWKRGGSQQVTAGIGNWRFATSRHVVGYRCACSGGSAAAVPGVVLDPFGGTGTTALVAVMLGRHGISVDASADYCRLAEWRASDPLQRAKAARPVNVRHSRRAEG